jgi:hypothetical protein
LVLYYRLLVPDDLHLVGDYHSKDLLIPQDFTLVGDNVPLIRHDFHLVLHCGLRHC